MPKDNKNSFIDISKCILISVLCKAGVFSSDSWSLSCQTLSLAISCDPIFFMISKILKINYQYVLCFCQGKLNSFSIQQNEMFTLFFL